MAPQSRFAGFAVGSSASAGEPLFRFGIVADPQYAPLPPRRGRYYRNSLGKLDSAIDTFNRHDLSFVATLGDLIDRGTGSFDPVLSSYRQLRHPSVLTLGNHDFGVSAEELSQVLGILGLDRAYYDFSGGGYRFVVLDGSEVSLFATLPGSPERREAERRLTELKAARALNAKKWNGGLSDSQFGWLSKILDAAGRAGEKVVVLNHYPVYPPNKHNLWDEARVLALIAKAQHVVAYFNGHNHLGNYGVVGGTHFVNFRGMVETESDTAYAVVAVHSDRIDIRGFGSEPSRTLAIATPNPAS